MKHFDAVEQAEETIEQVWSLLGEAHVQKARQISERLVQELLDWLEEDGEHATRLFYTKLAHACHAAGYLVAMSVRYTEAQAVIAYFEEMLRAAYELESDALATIALTYEGDMYRRADDFNEARRHLQRAYDLPQEDLAAHGNCAQLLARFYSQIGDVENFVRLMEEAECIAREIDPSGSSLHGQYSLGTVYIDYSKHYSKIGETAKALDYFARAEESLPDMPHWRTLVTATHGLLLVRNNNLEQGMSYVVEAAKLALDHGNLRLLDHFYALQSHLARKSTEFNQASVRLSEALYG